MTNKTIQQLTNELPIIGPKQEWIKKIISQGTPGDELYDVIGKDYMTNHSQTKPNNGNNGRKPIIQIITIPGTIGEMFDTWLANGWDCSNCIDANHPDGQERALEALRGYDKRGALTTDFRDQTEDSLSPQRLKYLSMLEDKYKQFMRSKGQRA